MSKTHVIARPIKRREFPQLTNADDSGPNWKMIAETCYSKAPEERIQKFCRELGVSKESLDQLLVGYSDKHEAVTIPEFDGKRALIGVSLRYGDGRKSCLKGSQRGLTIPQNLDELCGPIVIVEGASDTAALNSIGIASVGRPSAMAGFDLLVELFMPMQERELVVLGEFDPKRTGTWVGRDAAEKLARHLAASLNRQVQWGLPPTGPPSILSSTSVVLLRICR
jgi:hypothetical protein